MTSVKMLVGKCIRPVLSKCAIVKRDFSCSNIRHKAKLIDGLAMAKEIKLEVRGEVEAMVAAGKRPPKLCAVLVGDDPASQTYIKNKLKATKFTGIDSDTILLPDSVSERELLQKIERLNYDDSVDGILVQLPVPAHISERAVCNAVAPAKDVDGFHVVNVGRFCVDLQSMIPATPAGVIEMIKRSGVETFGRTAVVCGRSKNVGMPIAMLLHADGIGQTEACDATTIICHRYTPAEELQALAPLGDILVVATGIPGLITADLVKEGACVIDVGINRVKDKETGKFKLVGDVDFDAVSEKAGHITPVPGGVGPMTVAMLMKNTLKAAKREVAYF